MDVKREREGQRVMLSLSPLCKKVKDKSQRTGELIYFLCPDREITEHRAMS